ncbi:hypothetical protein C8Q80DRAFT_135108 [Daedaleopsis nitida]|nr:hypothetical protein C8Q80DRAFT_135108 [Daedaleopsis nitida]
MSLTNAFKSAHVHFTHFGMANGASAFSVEALWEGVRLGMPGPLRTVRHPRPRRPRQGQATGTRRRLRHLCSARAARLRDTGCDWGDRQEYLRRAAHSSVDSLIDPIQPSLTETIVEAQASPSPSSYTACGTPDPGCYAISILGCSSRVFNARVLGDASESTRQHWARLVDPASPRDPVAVAGSWSLVDSGDACHFWKEEVLLSASARGPA